MSGAAILDRRDRIGSAQATDEEPPGAKSQEPAPGSAIGARKATAEEPERVKAQELDAAAARTSRTEQDARPSVPNPPAVEVLPTPTHHALRSDPSAYTERTSP